MRQYSDDDDNYQIMTLNHKKILIRQRFSEMYFLNIDLSELLGMFQNSVQTVVNGHNCRSARNNLNKLDRSQRNVKNF